MDHVSCYVGRWEKKKFHIVNRCKLCPNGINVNNSVRFIFEESSICDVNYWPKHPFLNSIKILHWRPQFSKFPKMTWLKKNPKYTISEGINIKSMSKSVFLWQKSTIQNTQLVTRNLYEKLQLIASSVCWPQNTKCLDM